MNEASPLEKASGAFRKTFGEEPVHAFQAPGRVNLIGEHTDYNDGFVLPAAIGFGTVVVASPDDSRTLTLVAADYDDPPLTLDLIEPIERAEAPLWGNYLRGVVAGLGTRGPIKGAKLAISGNVPQGAGLSSSASLEVAVGTALTALSGLDLAPTDIAKIGQRAEHDFVGTKCGIMDQLVSAKAVKGHALLIDCRSLETRPVPMPADLALVIIHSNVKRGLVDSAYNERRTDCEEVARLLGVPALRDVGIDRLDALASLPDRSARRARHVITENKRTETAAEALARGDMQTLSLLMATSHQSMAEDFEITVPPIDLIVETVSSVLLGQGGVRMTGGGFGGCVVALAPHDAVPEIRAALARDYESATGLRETLWVTEAAAGAGALAL